MEGTGNLSIFQSHETKMMEKNKEESKEEQEEEPGIFMVTIKRMTKRFKQIKSYNFLRSLLQNWEIVATD